ncbi:stage VI sporulation protein D [Paenibacillus sp. J31TS4]|uniref:LysM peptidoglycan-binding domain-containing protein n=1 Tax=Paenibacillus sp. J31TS4 TaxID=2807195 RepID=UPI001B0EF9C5|nr:LysM peptidoglycan-binding domain-containing protein [Paenibacillus sp. J31TS4]GIP39188.1 stage VI sporulation protein D [Paenibacillus sp. J31TS4]
MTEHQTGLRFDIYERIHLAESLAGIRELDELELVPQIQVLQDNEQVILRGNLWLTGKYSAESGEENQTMEHFIPVEITLPLNRVQRLEDLAVEIEAFDVDLLSARSLNITGVLSLHGMGPITAEADNPLEEEFFVAYEAESSPPSEPAARDQLEASFNELKETLPGPFAEAIEEEAESVSAQAEEQEPEEEALPVQADADAEAVDADEEAAAIPVFAEAEETQKPEMKIAFGKAPSEQGGSVPGYVSFFKNLVHAPEPKSYEPEEPELRENASRERSEGIEWRRLLGEDSPSDTGFKRMRMCIVQKEETLDTIAEKYKINPREIALYNRLSGQEVSEGQVIYIP